MVPRSRCLAHQIQIDHMASRCDWMHFELQLVLSHMLPEKASKCLARGNPSILTERPFLHMALVFPGALRPSCFDLKNKSSSYNDLKQGRSQDFMSMLHFLVGASHKRGIDH